MFLKFIHGVCASLACFFLAFADPSITNLAFQAIKSLPPVPQLSLWQHPPRGNVSKMETYLDPLQSPSQEDQLASAHRQDTTEKIPECSGKAEAPPWATETEKNHVRR